MERDLSFVTKNFSGLLHDQATNATFLGRVSIMFSLCFDDSGMSFATRGKDEIQVGTSR